MKLIILVLVLIAAVAIFLFLKWFRGSKKVDYSFGDPTIKKLKSLIDSGAYADAETEIYSLNSDMLTQALDYIALSVNEKKIMKWQNNSTSTEVPTLLLGVHYIHQAWLSRGHSVAEDVSPEGIDGFQFYQDKAFEQLTEISDHSKLSTEAYTRLIRAHMGYGQVEEAKEFFTKAVAKDPNKLWPYIAYSEVIQPKWNGNIEMIQELMAALPSRRLTQQIVELKLIYDSMQSEENYFEGSMEDLKKRASKLLNTIDNELLKKEETSIQRYVLYSYMFVTANDINQKAMSEKYFKKMNNYYTLYPFGLMK